MSLLDCPADKGCCSPDNLTKWLAKRATGLVVTCQIIPVTGEKWLCLLTSTEEPALLDVWFCACVRRLFSGTCLKSSWANLGKVLFFSFSFLFFQRSWLGSAQVTLGLSLERSALSFLRYLSGYAFQKHRKSCVGWTVLFGCQTSA